MDIGHGGCEIATAQTTPCRTWQVATILCTDCGTPRHRVPSNTRYCWLCRLLRDIDYWRRNTRTCGCGAKFAPLNRADLHCSTCNPGLRAYSGPCVLATKDRPHEGRYPHPKLPVCVACTRDPKIRPRLIRALEVGQARRQSQNKEVPSAA